MWSLGYYGYLHLKLLKIVWISLALEAGSDGLVSEEEDGVGSLICERDLAVILTCCTS